MPCFHPLTAFWTGKFTKNGKRDYVIIHGQADVLPLSTFLKSYSKNHDYDKHILKYIDLNNNLCEEPVFTDPVPIPCGRCIGCRLEYSRTWAVRCLLEAKSFQNNYFVTLTYDDDHLPANGSLVKSDLQKFLKRLREYFRRNFNHDNIRFYACGEYGERSMRPHYHLILFNCPLPDLKLFSTRDNINLYLSDIIAKCWTLGIHSVGEVNFETAAYTARYVMKKHYGATANYYSNLGIIPEFVTMSRRPGIAQTYFESNKSKIYSTDEIIYKRGDSVYSVKPCSYFDKKYDLDDPLKLAYLKSIRVNRAKLHRANVLKFNEFKTDRDYLEHSEELKNSSLSLLVRKKL